MGIPKHILPRIGSAFVQARPSIGRQFGGSGLGLSIVRRLAVLMGGELFVKSQENRGSEFSITFRVQLPSRKNLPLNSTSNSSSRDYDGSSRETSPPHSLQRLCAYRRDHGRAIRVLAAEDNMVNQKILKHFLASCTMKPNSCGNDDGDNVNENDEELLLFDCKFVENGALAVEATIDALEHEQAFDVILMDLTMPVMDGKVAAHTIVHKTSSAAPILALTGNATIAVRDECTSIGFADFITKPFHVEKLLQVIANAITSPV